MQTIVELQEFQRKARGNKLSYSTPSNRSCFTWNWGIIKFRWASANKGNLSKAVVHKFPPFDVKIFVQIWV
jgi:hypothetical protein